MSVPKRRMRAVRQYGSKQQDNCRSCLEFLCQFEPPKHELWQQVHSKPTKTSTKKMECQRSSSNTQERTPKAKPFCTERSGENTPHALWQYSCVVRSPLLHTTKAMQT